jgi:hypothetical protein
MFSAIGEFFQKKINLLPRAKNFRYATSKRGGEYLNNAKVKLLSALSGKEFDQQRLNFSLYL